MNTETSFLPLELPSIKYIYIYKLNILFHNLFQIFKKKFNFNFKDSTTELFISVIMKSSHTFGRLLFTTFSQVFEQCIHAFDGSYIHPISHSSILPFIQSPIHSFFHSSILSFSHSCILSFSHSFIRSIHLSLPYLNQKKTTNELKHIQNK